MSSYSRCTELSGEPFGSSCRITYSKQQPIMLSNYSQSCRPNKWLWQNTERSCGEIPENSLSYFFLLCLRLVWSFRYTAGEAKCSLMGHSGVNDTYICRIERKNNTKSPGWEVKQQQYHYILTFTKAGRSVWFYSYTRASQTFCNCKINAIQAH